MVYVLLIVASLFGGMAQATPVQIPAQNLPGQADLVTQEHASENVLDEVTFYHLLLGYLYGLSEQSQLSSQAFLQALLHNGSEHLLRDLAQKSRRPKLDDNLNMDTAILSEAERKTLSAIVVGTSVIRPDSTKLKATVERLLLELNQTPHLRPAATELEVFYVQKLIALKQTEEAQAVLHTFLQHSPEAVKLWYMQATMAIEKRRWNTVFSSMERLLQSAKTPNEVLQGKLFLIQSALESNDTVLQERVYALLQPEAQNSNTDPSLFFPLSILAQRLDDQSVTYDLLERLIAARPQDPFALNALGYTLADANQSLERARDLIRQALALQPDSPEIIDSMGWVEYRLGNLKAAREHLERAYALMPSAEGAAHLGEVYWALQKPLKAQTIWQEGFIIGPQDPVLLETIHRLVPHLKP